VSELDVVTVLAAESWQELMTNCADDLTEDWDDKAVDNNDGAVDWGTMGLVVLEEGGCMEASGRDVGGTVGAAASDGVVTGGSGTAAGVVTSPPFEGAWTWLADGCSVGFSSLPFATGWLVAVTSGICWVDSVVTVDTGGVASVVTAPLVDGVLSLLVTGAACCSDSPVIPPFRPKK
jgi:hypothetical protein